MEAEAMPFVEHLQLQQDTTVFAKNLPFVAYSGYLPPRSSKSSTTITNSQETRTTHDTDTGTWGWSKLVKFLQDTFRAKRKHKVTVVTNGKDTIHGTNVDNVGTVPAAMVTYVALESLQDVDLVMNAGTAGGFAHKGASIADVYVTHTVAHHDRRIPIPDFIPYGIGKVTTHIYQVLDTMALQMGYKIGICTTGNSLDASDQDHVHMTANNASLKDMELAAIAWSCQLHDTPWIGLKVVTDIVNGGMVPYTKCRLCVCEKGGCSLTFSYVR